MIDVILLAYACSFIFMASVVLVYYSRIKQEYKKYVGAKDILDNIIISFNAEVKSTKEKIKG